MQEFIRTTLETMLEHTFNKLTELERHDEVVTKNQKLRAIKISDIQKRQAS